MRLQLALLAALVALAAWARVAMAEEQASASTTWYQEKRGGSLGGVTVIHPQVDVGFGVGDHVDVDGGYSADVVSGATSSVYSVDAVSTATPFDDARHAGRLGVTISGSRSALSVGISAATERDYASLAGTIGGNIDLPGKNTNLAVSYTHNFDEVCARDNAEREILEREALVGDDTCEKDVLFGVDRPGETVWQDLGVDTFQATLTQNLTPTLVGQLSLFGQVLQGFQENPYRRVRVSGREPRENLPDMRARVALTARINKFVEATRGTVHLSARGYSDTWGVNSAAMGLGYSQYFGHSLIFRLRGRVYQQTSATFFKDAFFYDTEGPAGAYFTGDRELATIRDVVVGGKLSYVKAAAGDEPVWGLFREIVFDLKGDVMFFQELPTDPLSQNPMGIDGQFLSSNQLLDAIVLQAGLTLAY